MLETTKIKYDNFVEQLVLLDFKNNTEAARLAGYDKNPKLQGHRLITNDYVLEKIAEKKAEIKLENETTHQQLTQDFQRLAGKSEKIGKLRTAITAKEQIAKHIGYYEADNAQQSSPLTQIGIVLTPQARLADLEREMLMLKELVKAGTAIAGEV